MNEQIINTQEKEFKIWMEGYATTGDFEKATMIGTSKGFTFDDAIRNYIENNPKSGIKKNKKTRYSNEEAYQNRKSNWNIWACNLFDNETDARKSFG